MSELYYRAFRRGFWENLLAMKRLGAESLLLIVNMLRFAADFGERQVAWG